MFEDKESENLAQEMDKLMKEPKSSDEDIIESPPPDSIIHVLPKFKSSIVLEKPKQPKSFLRWDNKVLWVAGLSLGFVVLLMILLAIR